MYEDSSREMKCTLNPNIASISGRIGGLEFRTFKRANGKTETRAYALPKKPDGTYGYVRHKPYSDKELAIRTMFTKASTAFATMPENERKQYYDEWKKANYKFNGKKYNTFRGYVIARLITDFRSAMSSKG